MSNKINLNELYSSRIIDTYIKFLRKEYDFKEKDIDELLKFANIKREEINNPTKWFSQVETDRFMEYLNQIIKNENINDIAFKAGLYAATPEASGLMRKIFIGFMGPERAYSVIGKYTEKYYSRSAKYEYKKIENKRYRIIVTPYDGVNEKPFQCYNRKGYFKAISKLFNKNAEILDHKECCCPEKGKKAKSCIYEITWDQSAIDNDNENKIKELERIIKEQQDSAEGLLEQIQLSFETANLLRDIGNKIDATPTIEDIDSSLESIPELIIKRLNYSRCAIFLVDREQTRLLCRISFGFSTNDTRNIHRYSVNLKKDKESIFGNIFNHQEPQVVNELEEIEPSTPDRELEFLKEIDTKQFAICPITYKGHSVGLLFADNPHTERELDQSDINLLMAVVPQIGVVIDKYFEKIGEIRERLGKKAKGIPVPSRFKRVAPTDIKRTPIDSLVTFFHVLKNSLGIDPDTSKYLEEQLEELTRQQRQQMESHEQTRKEVVQRALHSIQNPAFNLLNSIDLMKMEIDSPELKEELNRMENNVERIRGIAKDFSRYLKPLSDRIESFDILKIIHDVIYRNLSNDRKIKEEFSEDVIRVKADKSEIEWVVEELLQNAFKSGAMNVCIEAKIEKKSVNIYFRDNGRGIREEDRENIFVPFKMAGSLGTGIGLANVKKIMEGYSGDIFFMGPTYKNNEEKPGAEFLISMPVERGGSNG